ncbi:hypothetical protein O181_117422 [Austropuccinia psidii MF-1]|uniref:Uncharacterized protein n=1 Tax=Austropuccinia psidii MF-1 TaxID=1389203 RepID=A0A9Q3KB76_9BASI|nr:hypothetical protein [Austropuccinia psidii MF-1]
MPSTRFGASYNPSSSSQKGHIHDYGRIILKLIKLFYLQKELTPPQEASVDIYKSSQKAYSNALQHKEYQILADLWKNCMNSYLTVRNVLGYPNTCNLFNGWNPLMEKKNMMLLTSEWRENNPSPPKNSPSGQKQKFQREKAATSSEQGHRKGTSHRNLQPGLEDCKDSTGCHGKCISDSQNNDGIENKEEARFKYHKLFLTFFVPSQSCMNL